MKRYRSNSLLQLSGVLAGFVLTIALLESEGLVTWAERLEIGPGRQEAVASAAALHRALGPLGFEGLRREGLGALDRLGWSDDPDRGTGRLAPSEARAAACPVVKPSQKPGANLAAGVAGAHLEPVRGTGIGLAPVVPKVTPLVPLPPIADSKPRVVALVGDSMMAVGLSDVLLRETAGNPHVQVIKAFKSGTGLARPEVFDWMREYPAMLGNRQPDVIFVAIGANDGQGFVENGQVLAFGTDAWIRVYQQRTAAFLNMLTEHGAQVVWMGLPPMKSEKYDQKTELINRIAYTVVSQYPTARWWNSDSSIGDETGTFREFAMQANGKATRLRAADGIHLSDEGAELLAPTLLSWLNAPAVTAQAAAVEGKTEGKSQGR